MVAKVYVGNLSWDTTDDGLARAFASWGALTDYVVMRDRETGRSRGFGFVTYSSQEEADAAIQGMNEQQLDGRTIRVNMANSRPNRTDGGYNAGFAGGFNGYGAAYGTSGAFPPGASFGLPPGQGFAGIPNPYQAAQPAFGDPAAAAAAAAAAAGYSAAPGGFGAPQGFVAPATTGYGSPQTSFASQGAFAPPSQASFAPQGAYPTSQGGFAGQYGFPPPTA